MPLFVEISEIISFYLLKLIQYHHNVIEELSLILCLFCQDLCCHLDIVYYIYYTNLNVCIVNRAKIKCKSCELCLAWLLSFANWKVFSMTRAICLESTIYSLYILSVFNSSRDIRIVQIWENWEVRNVCQLRDLINNEPVRIWDNIVLVSM